jgi:hypothetical protein
MVPASDAPVEDGHPGALAVTMMAAVLAAQPAARPSARKAAGTRATPTPTTIKHRRRQLAPDVVGWYRQQKYHFLVLSDHDMITAVEGLNALFGASSTVSGERRPEVPSNPFLLIPGEEVTDKFSPREASGEAVKGRDLTSRRSISPR